MNITSTTKTPVNLSRYVSLQGQDAAKGLSENANVLPFQGALTQDTVSIRFGAKMTVQPGQTAASKFPPEYTKESRNALYLLSNLNVPKEAKNNWPLALAQILLDDETVQKYLGYQDINYDEVQGRILDKIITSNPTDPNQREQISPDTIKSMTQSTIKYALGQSSANKSVTPLIMWRWLMNEDPAKNMSALLTESGLKEETVKRLRIAPAEVKLPGFSTESAMILENLKDFNLPKKADAHWPIAMMQFLLSDNSVQGYLDSQKINWNDLFVGMRQSLIPKLLEKVGKQKEVLPLSSYDQIALGAQNFALTQGAKKVTPVLLWRWMMTEDPAKNMDNILSLALPGAKDEIVQGIRMAPAQKIKDKAVVSRPTKDDIVALNKALDEVPQKVIGQDKPIKLMLKDIKRASLGYNSEENPHKPKSVVLMLGPSGVGKTYSAEKIAEAMGRPMIYVPMNEFKDGQNVAKLTGAAPGYVGFGEAESFADKMVKANDATAKNGTPPPIIVFDEIEKANKGVFDVIMQIFDKGQIQTGKGQTASFEGTYVLMTSNIGQRQIAKAKAENKTEEEIQAIVNKVLEGDLTEEERAQNPDFEGFRPEFIGRINSKAIFETLSKENTGKILDLSINRIKKSAKTEDGYTLEVSPELRNYILEKGYSVKTGAREVKNQMEKILHNALMEKREQLIVTDKLGNAGTMKASLVMDDEKTGHAVFDYFAEAQTAVLETPAGTPTPGTAKALEVKDARVPLPVLPPQSPVPAKGDPADIKPEF